MAVVAKVSAVHRLVCAARARNIAVQQAPSSRDGLVHRMRVVIAVWSVVVLAIAVQLTASAYLLVSAGRTMSNSFSCGTTIEYCGGPSLVVAAPAVTGQCRVTGCPTGSCCSQYG